MCLLFSVCFVVLKCGIDSPEQPSITTTSDQDDSASINDSPLRTATPLPGSAVSLPPQARHPATSKVKLTSGVTLAHWDIDESVSSSLALTRTDLMIDDYRSSDYCSPINWTSKPP